MNKGVALLACIAVASLSWGAEVGVKGLPTYPQFQTFPTFRSFDGPGTVFRIDAKKRRFLVKELDVVKTDGSEDLGAYHRTSRWWLGVLLSFLGRTTAAAGRELEVTTFFGPAIHERTTDNDIARALRAADIAFQSDSRYFVIRETIAVGSVYHRFSSGRSLSLTVGDKAELDRLIEVRPDLRWDRDCARDSTTKEPAATPVPMPVTSPAASPAPSPTAVQQPMPRSPDAPRPSPMAAESPRPMAAPSAVPSRAIWAQVGIAIDTASGACLVRTFDQERPGRIYYLPEEYLPGRGVLGSDPLLVPVKETLSWVSEAR